MKFSSALWVACAAVFLITGCQTVVPSSPTPQAPPSEMPVSSPIAARSQGAVFALLRDNRLIATRIQDGVLIFDQRLTPPTESTNQEAGHLLALSKDGTKLFALLSDDPISGSSSLVVVDVPRMKVVYTYPLTPPPAEHPATFHTLAVGSTSGHIYLFGNRGKAAVIALADLENGLLFRQWTARESNGYDYQVYEGAVSGDEQRIFLSYHSADTGGIDWFDVMPTGLRRCSSPLTGRTCLAAHGGFQLYRDFLLAATGSNVILEVNQEGAVRRGFDTHLSGNHLMEFVADQSSNRIYAVGECGYTGGFSAVTLSDGGVPTTPQVPGDWTWLSTPAPPPVFIAPAPDATDPSRLPCGDRVAYSPAYQVLVVAQTPGSIGGAGKNGALLYLDVTTGNLLRTVSTPVWPLDVMIVPGAET